jgi:hypothetical protein
VIYVYWTLNIPERGVSITLCSPCALSAFNAGSVGYAEFTTVEEAAVTMCTVAAFQGKDFDISSSDTGACENCKSEVAA